MKVRNKVTGEIVEIPDAPGARPIGPSNPKLPGELEALELRNRQLRANIDSESLSREKTALDMRQGGGLSVQDQTFLNAMRDKVGPIDETVSMLSNAAKAVDRFGTGPESARMARWATEEEDKTGPIAGLADWMGSKIFGNQMPQQKKDDWQYLTGLKNEAVLLKQAEQKGPQTESDAIRMGLTSLSPDKFPKVNAKVLGSSILNARLSQRRPAFYTEWAQKYGSVNAPDKQGRSVDQAWQTFSNTARQHYTNNPKVKALSGGGKAKPKSAKVIDFNDLPE